MRKFNKNLLLSLLIVCISCYVESSENKVDENYYKIVYDSYLEYKFADDNVAFRYFVVEYNNFDTIPKIIDTIYSGGVIQSYDSTISYGDFCDSANCYLLVYNLKSKLLIDTVFTWSLNPKKLNPMHTSYVFNFKDSIIAFYDIKVSADKRKINDIGIIAKIRSDSTLDTLQQIPYLSDYPPTLSFDKSQIFFGGVMACNNDTSMIYQTTIGYDILDDSIFIPNLDNCTNMWLPNRFSRNTPIFYFSPDTINLKHNIWKLESSIETKITSLPDSLILQYAYITFTADSLLVYWVKEVNGIDTVETKIEVKAF